MRGEDDYSKTIEQTYSPNDSTFNLENMKKTQSLHYMKASSGANSPQQIKSRSSLGGAIINHGILLSKNHAVSGSMFKGSLI